MREFPEYQGPMVNWPRIEVLPHVEEVLTRLHPDYILVLASNASRIDEAAIWAALERAGWPALSTGFTALRSRLQETRPRVLSLYPGRPGFRASTGTDGGG